MAAYDHKKLGKLLQQAQAGDQKALEELCKALEGFIRGYFQKRFPGKPFVDDLCQETYIRLLKNLPQIREETKLTAFVAKVAFHVMQDHFRQHYRRKEEALEKEFLGEGGEGGRLKAEPIGNPIDVQVLNRLDMDTAMQQLSERSREIMLLKSQGYKYQEIAEKVGLTISGVKMQVKRSMEQLRTLLFPFLLIIMIKIICFFVTF